MIVRYSKIGKAMRAVSEDKEAAQLMGIDVNQTISVTFAIGSGLAAVAGVLLCSAYPLLDADSGCNAWNQSLYRSCFRRNRLHPGRHARGILLGVIEILGKAYISTELSDAIVFSVLIIVLLVRPTGLLGKKSARKVGCVHEKS